MQGDKHLAAHYSGVRAPLRPVYDAVAAVALALGDDVTVMPKREYVTFVRRRQFAVIQPGDRGEVELLLCLGDVPAEGRLEEVDAHGGSLTHRIRLKTKGDVDAFVRTRLRRAYDKA